jgi:hypothetical protein
MTFAWWEPMVPAMSAERGATARRAMHAAEVRGRAALLKRLGHDEAYAAHRCIGNIEWAFELRGTPPLSREEVKKLVAGVFKG